ncbi:MFS transporter [Massilia sp. DD77]|uniref:MFS transporter n=1 Tax=Massilia sp. DD77 TaxID=3109349 RepID=UPI002FFD875B
MSAVSTLPLPRPDALRPRLIALGAVTSVEFIENGMVMFAAGQIAAGLHLSAQEFAFAYTLYGAGAILMLFKHRWMVERLGYRRFVLLSLACFGIGSALCALAGGLAQFAAGRLLQGLGGATFFTAGRLAMNDLPEPARRAGLLTFVASLLGASAIAPLLAVGLMELGQWRALFWFGVPQALLVGWGAHAHLSRSVIPREERSTEHWGWLLWLCAGVFGLQHAIQAIGLGTSEPRTVALAAGTSILMLAVFAWRQRRRERPLIDCRGLAQQRYLLGLAMYFIGYCLIGSSGLMVPILLHTVLSLSLLESAMVTSCAMAGSVTVALLHLRLAQGRPRHRLFMLAGLALFGAGSLGLSTADARSAWPELAPAVLAIYLAIPLFLGPVAAATFTGLPGKAFSHGYQVKNIIRQVGLSSSIALATVALHLVSREQVFTLMAMAVIPAGLAVMAQREFR